MTHRLLLLIQTPPPYHGSNIMNGYLLAYVKREHLNYLHIPFNSAKTMSSVGKFDFSKVFSSIKLLLKLFRMQRGYSHVYIVMSVNRFAFYRDAIIVMFLKLLGKQLILHLRVKGFRNKRGLARLIAGLVFRNVSVIQHSKLLYSEIEAFDTKQNFFVPNGFPDRFPDFETSTKGEGQTTNVIFLSNLIESKGVYVLLDAMKMKKDSLGNCQFHFIGNWYGIKENDFYEYVKENGLEQLVGEVKPLYNDAKYEFLNKMDLMVFPTFYPMETWGNVILEAMMFKLPVISTFEGAIPEVIDDNETGFLVPQQNVAALAEKMMILIEDRQLRQKMGEKGRKKFLKRYTLSVFEENMDRTFKEIFNS